MKDRFGYTVFRNGKTPTISSFDNKGGVYLPNKIDFDFISVIVRAERCTESNYWKEGAIYHFKGQGYRFRDISKCSKNDRVALRKKYGYMKKEDISELLHNMIVAMGFVPCK